MNDWKKKISKSILLGSDSGNLKDALSEWFFTGKVFDRETPVHSCELCGHNHVRYQYIIANSRNRNKLNVGSSCILRYKEIVVYNSRKELVKGDSERKSILMGALDGIRKEAALSSLRAIWKAESPSCRSIIESQVKKYKENGSASPKVCLMWFVIMNKHKVEYAGEDFRVNLRKKRFMDQILDFNRNEFDLISPALSSAQLKKAACARGK